MNENNDLTCCISWLASIGVLVLGCSWLLSEDACSALVGACAHVEELYYGRKYAYTVWDSGELMSSAEISVRTCCSAGLANWVLDWHCMVAWSSVPVLAGEGLPNEGGSWGMARPSNEIGDIGGEWGDEWLNEGENCGLAKSSNEIGDIGGECQWYIHEWRLAELWKVSHPWEVGKTASQGLRTWRITGELGWFSNHPQRDLHLKFVKIRV